jgi:alpha-ketoglutarate-dependent taurine dioxygenase
MDVDAADGCTLGAFVTGVDLRSLDDAQWSCIEAAFHTHALLVFPGQFLDDREQSRFARRFGRFERGMANLGSATVWPISNVLADGSLADADGVLAAVLVGNQGWHTDSSYHRVSAKVSLLSARVVPGTGGTTEWADMRAAYDALGDEDRALVEGRDAAHSYLYSQRQLGRGEEMWTDADKASMAEVRHPIVALHPETGRRSLFLGRHAHAVRGLADDESAALVERLMDFACRSPRVFAHSWQAGDIAVWDNRCVLHRGRPWDMREPRVMRHTRIAGDGDNEWALVDE